MAIVCNIWMICFKLNQLFYDTILSEFVWKLRSSDPLTNTFNISVLSVEDRERVEEGMGLDKMVEVFQNSPIQGIY